MKTLQYQPHCNTASLGGNLAGELVSDGKNEALSGKPPHGRWGGRFALGFPGPVSYRSIHLEFSHSWRGCENFLPFSCLRDFSHTPEWEYRAQRSSIGQTDRPGISTNTSLTKAYQYMLKTLCKTPRSRADLLLLVFATTCQFSHVSSSPCGLAGQQDELPKLRQRPKALLFQFSRRPEKLRPALKTML